MKMFNNIFILMLSFQLETSVIFVKNVEHLLDLVLHLTKISCLNF